MSKVLQQKSNTFKSKQVGDKDSTNKQKSNDFIFKRYRYEENTLINAGTKNGKTAKFQDDHEYEQQTKENELQKYKKQLQQQTNHFEVMDFGEGDDEQEDNEKQEEQVNEVEVKQASDNPFQFDEAPETQRTQKQRPQSLKQLPSNKSLPRQKKHQQFDVKPMELVDFQEEEEQQATTQNPVQQNIFNSNRHSEDSSCSQQNSNVYPPISASSHKSSLSFQKSNVSETFMISPDQSLDGGLGLEESVCNFMKKGKKTSKDPNQQLEKCFTPQNLGYEKYEIHKLSENDNPFEDAVDYSNQEEELKGVKIYQSPHEDIKVQIFDKELFASSKIPPGIILKCKLKRSKGFFSMMNPQFDLYLENGLKHLVSARKNLFRNRQLFHISTQVSNFQRPVRTLMANVLHNTYWLVDAPRTIDKKKISYLDLLIEYEPFDQEEKKQRLMTVLCPPSLKTYHIGLQYDIPYIDFQWFKRSISLKLYYKGGDETKVKTSDKNFELVDSEDEDDTKDSKYEKESESSPKEKTGQTLVNQSEKEEQKETYHYLKMHKSSQNIFDVQIQHPLTPLQAMAIILTRFDAQLK